jgi:hypothetical protein
MKHTVISIVLTIILITALILPVNSTTGYAQSQPMQGSTQNPTVTVIIMSGSPVPIISYNAGDKVDVTATLSTSDPNENGEGEPLILQSSTGFSGTVSAYAQAQTFSFTATMPGTLSGFIQGFDDDESASVTATLNSSSVKFGILTQQDRDRLNFLSRLLNTTAGGTATIFVLCSGGIVDIPYCLPIGVFSGATWTLSGLLNLLAEDPSDPNFTVIAQPVIPTLPPITPSGNLTAAEAAAFNALFTNEAQAIGYTRAIITSYNRAQGAFDAGNSFWLGQQLQAVHQYQGTLVLLLQTEITLRTNLVNLLSADPGILPVTITPSQVLQFETSVVSNGLPASIVETLTQLGADSAAIDNIRMIAIVQDINAVAGNYPAKIADPQLIDAIRQLTKGLGGLCLQDNTSGSTMMVNQTTGDYQFTNCRKGIVLTGKGTITVNSCKLSLVDFGPDRKHPDRNIQILINTCTGVASGTVQMTSPKFAVTINDANYRLNTCICR